MWWIRFKIPLPLLRGEKKKASKASIVYVCMHAHTQTHTERSLHRRTYTLMGSSRNSNTWTRRYWISKEWKEEGMSASGRCFLWSPWKATPLAKVSASNKESVWMLKTTREHSFKKSACMFLTSYSIFRTITDYFLLITLLVKNHSNMNISQVLGWPIPFDSFT